MLPSEHFSISKSIVFKYFKIIIRDIIKNTNDIKRAVLNSLVKFSIIIVDIMD